VDELTSIPGIGETALNKIRHYLIPLRGENGQSVTQEDHLDEAQDDEPPHEAQLYETEVIALPAPGQVELLDSDKTTDEDQGKQSLEAVEQASEKDGEPQVLLAEEELAAKEEPTLAPKAEQITEPVVVIPKYEPVSKEQPRYASRSDAFWISFGNSFLAFLLAIGLTLGALALINNGLRYVSPTQLGSVSRQVEGLNTQASILQQDLEGLRTRVDNLEGLSGRVSTIEQTTEQLRSDLDTASGQVEQLNQNVSILQTDFTELKNVSDRFQNFLDGLRELLNNEQQ
jgi:prefoldin subunit 5